MDFVGIGGLLLGIASLAYAVHSTRQLTKGVKIGALRHLRTLINRMEEEKRKHPQTSEAWLTMHHSQQELDATFKSLQAMFDIADKDAPLV
jgi:hypothetical protein